MKRLITFSLVTISILKSDALVVDFNQNDINTTVKLPTKPRFTNLTFEKLFSRNKLKRNPKAYQKSEKLPVLFQSKIFIQNQCDAKHFIDENNKRQYCPTNGLYPDWDRVNSQKGVYFILHGCSSKVNGEQQY